MNKKTTRYYSEPWRILKQNKILSLVPTISTNPEIVAKWVKTTRKAIGKEKYNDESFRVAYPSARLTSTFDEDTKKLTFNLDLGITIDRVEELFN